MSLSGAVPIFGQDLVEWAEATIARYGENNLSAEPPTLRDIGASIAVPRCSRCGVISYVGCAIRGPNEPHLTSAMICATCQPARVTKVETISRVLSEALFWASVVTAIALIAIGCVVVMPQAV